jgi:plastocyanin
MKKNQNIYAIIAIIIIAGVSFYLYQQNSNTSTSTFDNSANELRSVTESTSQATSTSESQSASPTTTSATTESIAETATIITISNASSLPAKTTLKIGDEVKFLNSTAKQISIFSTEYPQNTDFLALNIGIIEPSQKCAPIKFTKSGTYKYYEHANPTKIAAIVVE